MATASLTARDGEPGPQETRGDAPLFAGVALVSMAVLVLQIALTRIFSFTIWYHFAYVTIGVALLGYGASGAVIAVLRPGPLEPAGRLSLLAGCGAIAVPCALGLLGVIPFHPFALASDPWRQVPWMLATYLVVAAPFFLAGVVMALALRHRCARVRTLYAFDLGGAALGGGIVAGAIWWLSTPGTVVLASALLGIAAIALALPAGGRAVARAAALAAIATALGFLALRVTPFTPSPEKFQALFSGKGFSPLGHRWTPIYRTDVARFDDEDLSRQFSYAGWGISPRWKEETKTRSPRIRLISHDGDACAVIYQFDGDLEKLEMFDHHILSAPYTVLDRPEVLVIGVGGGTDIVNALRHHARHVTGVELDPVTVDVVRREQADFAGHLYDRPDVTVLSGEGRGTLRRSNARYDLIQLSGVDTLAALTTGAYVLSESYLYTVEAMDDFYDHLTPDGLLSVVVADDDETVSFPRHTMRQLALFIEALARRGIADPARHVAVLASAEGTPQVACLLRKRAFTGEEVARLQAFSDAQGFRVWALPGKEIDRVHSRFLRMDAPARAAFLHSAPLSVKATTDDNPFFFNFYRWRSLLASLREIDVGHTKATGQLLMVAMLGQSALLAGAFIILPLLLFARRGLRVAGAPGLALYFAGIGVGFILIEISFVQRFVLFLGYPTYSLSIVLLGLLAFSGVGSLLSARLPSPPLPRAVASFAALTTVSGIYLALLPRVLDQLLPAPLPVRAVAALLSLAPLGIPMGTFFPSGIEVVRRVDAAFVPWAWACNGSASVVGTVLAVMLAMSFGFRSVTLIALGCYGIAVIGLRSASGTR
ncbi:MAG: hypothetical protein U0166_05555 [Acidobacteriota bacterium]